MQVITISRTYGSDGRTVGQKVAEALGYLYLDKELIVMVAYEAKVSLSEVERFDERPESAVMRVLDKLLVPGPIGTIDPGWWHYSAYPGFYRPEEAPLDEDTCVRLTQEVMMYLAMQQNIVVIGRGSHRVFAGLPEVLHVRVVAPEDFRIGTVVARDNLTPDAARAQLRQVDEQRRRYLKRHYGVDWDDPEHYDLILNTGRIGVEEAACLLMEAVGYLPIAQEDVVGV